MKAFANNQTISWFYQRYKEGNLELDPDFQRNPVWLQTQKDYLLETILLELPVPEVYMVNRINSVGESVYVVVDGQQRLRTILEFVTGEHRIKTIVDHFKRIKKFDDLTESEKQKFWRFPIVVRDLEDSSELEVRDLFQRLNKYSFVLNDQELRNAKYQGEFLKAVEKITENEFWVTSGLFSPNDFRRMIDLEFVSILVSTLIGGIYNRKERIDEFYINYESEFDKDQYIDRVNNILDIIKSAIPNLKETRWKNKADFYTLFLFIDTLKIQVSDIDEIKKLRSALEKFEADINEARLMEESEIDKDINDYLKAATADTNSKEPRVRRLRILINYVKKQLEPASV